MHAICKNDVCIRATSAKNYYVDLRSSSYHDAKLWNKWSPYLKGMIWPKSPRTLGTDQAQHFLSFVYASFDVYKYCIVFYWVPLLFFLFTHEHFIFYFIRPMPGAVVLMCIVMGVPLSLGAYHFCIILSRVVLRTVFMMHHLTYIHLESHFF